jgi:aminopeptidase N
MHSIPSFDFPNIELDFKVYTKNTDTVEVTSRLSFTQKSGANNTLELFGINLKLTQISLNKTILKPSQYSLTTEPTTKAQKLSIINAPENGILEVSNILHPKNNQENDGLRDINGIIYAYCNDSGTMKIAFSPDLENLASYSTNIFYKDDGEYSNIIANGEQIEQRKFKSMPCVQYSDTHKKPSAAFKIVCGNLRSRSEYFEKNSQEDIDINIYYDDNQIITAHNEDLPFSIIKQALEYDRSTFSSYPYNELNILMLPYNSAPANNTVSANLKSISEEYFIGDPDTTADSILTQKYAEISKPIFYTNLNEKFDITGQWKHDDFMEQMAGPGYRMQEMRTLRNAYINNSLTEKQKFSELPMTLMQMVGRAKFITGLKLNLEKNQDTFVSLDNFMNTLAIATTTPDSPEYQHIIEFKKWFNIAGIPRLMSQESYNKNSKKFTFTIYQDEPIRPIPISLQLISKAGKKLHERNNIIVDKSICEFIFTVNEQPIVDSQCPTNKLTEQELYTLFAHSTYYITQDWYAEQCKINLIKNMINEYMTKLMPPIIPQEFLNAYSLVLDNTTLNLEAKVLVLTMPSEYEISSFVNVIDLQAIRTVRTQICQQIAHKFEDKFKTIYNDCNNYWNQDNAKDFTPEAIARRVMQNFALAQLMLTKKDEYVELCVTQNKLPYNIIGDVYSMTTIEGALQSIVTMDYHNKDTIARTALRNGANKYWLPGYMSSWFKIQGLCTLPTVIQDINALITGMVVNDDNANPVLDINNQHNVKQLFMAFVYHNPEFHNAAGSGYKLVIDFIIDKLDSINSKLASELLPAFKYWYKFTDNSPQKSLMQTQLQRIVNAPNISNECKDIASKLLTQVPIQLQVTTVRLNKSHIHENLIPAKTNNKTPLLTQYKLKTQCDLNPQEINEQQPLLDDKSESAEKCSLFSYCW